MEENDLLQESAEGTQEAVSEPPAPPEPHDAREDDINRFVHAFPGVYAEDIPREVWDDVRAGEPLVSAYARRKAAEAAEDNRRLRAELERARHDLSNREHAAGSQQTAGNNTTKIGPFDQGWEEI